MNKTNVKTKPSTTHRHDTPNNKTHIIKFLSLIHISARFRCPPKACPCSFPAHICRWA